MFPSDHQQNSGRNTGKIKKRIRENSLSEIESINSEDEASAPEEARETNVAAIDSEEESFESNVIGSDDNESRCKTIIEENTDEVAQESAPGSTGRKKNRSNRSPTNVSTNLHEVLTFSNDS
jgi:hypothetical protein